MISQRAVQALLRVAGLVFIQKDILQDSIGYLRVPYTSLTERSELDKKAQSLNAPG